MFLRDGNFLYFLGWCGYNLFFRIFHRMKVEGLDKVPETGGFIVASNHVSTFDPPAVGSALPRAIHYMAKKELFNNPVFGWILRKVNAFPVVRTGADIGAFREAERLLEQGKVLLIFPQGGRRTGENFKTVKSGVGLIACRAQVPVVPCAVISPGSVDGAKGLTIRFSDSLQPPPKCGKADYEAFSALIVNRIKEILE